MTTADKLIPLAGYYRVALVNNVLSPASSGTIQTVTLQQPLPNGIVSLVLQGNLYARLGCGRNENSESIYVQKNSYNSNNRTIKIIRGASVYASNDTTNAVKDFTVPRDLFLDFGYVDPSNLQVLADLVNNLNGLGSDFFNARLPKADRDNAGVVKTAYRSPSRPTNEAGYAITNDSPALNSIYQAIYGLTTNSTDIQTLNSLEQQRVAILGELINLLVNTPGSIDKLRTLLNT